MDASPSTARTDQPTSEHTVDIREEAAADARAVAESAKEQTRSAMAGMNQQVRRQMSDQKSQLANTIREWGVELDKASANSSGTVADLASEAAERARRVSWWMDTHEPADAVRSVEDFARRRPMLFLASAAIAGAVVGRITRNAMAARRSQSTGTGIDRAYYAGGPRTDPEYLGPEQQIVTGEVPPMAGPSGQGVQPHMTGEPVDEARLTHESGPLSQRAYDAQSEYPSNDQPVIDVGDELPPPGTRIGQGPREEGGRR